MRTADRSGFARVAGNDGRYLYLNSYHSGANFDGMGRKSRADRSNGNHTVQHSPDRKYVIDTWSRVDMPPVNELRRVADGSVARRSSTLRNRSPRVGRRPRSSLRRGLRDGATDIWGIICRPRPFDPSKKYPIIEDIYAGPQGSLCQKTFSASSRYESLTKVGFVVVKIDAMEQPTDRRGFTMFAGTTSRTRVFPIASCG